MPKTVQIKMSPGVTGQDISSIDLYYNEIFKLCFHFNSLVRTDNPKSSISKDLAEKGNCRNTEIQK